MGYVPPESIRKGGELIILSMGTMDISSNNPWDLWGSNHMKPTCTPHGLSCVQKPISFSWVYFLWNAMSYFRIRDTSNTRVTCAITCQSRAFVCHLESVIKLNWFLTCATNAESLAELLLQTLLLILLAEDYSHSRLSFTTWRGAANKDMPQMSNNTDERARL